MQQHTKVQVSRKSVLTVLNQTLIYLSSLKSKKRQYSDFIFYLSIARHVICRCTKAIIQTQEREQLYHEIFVVLRQPETNLKMLTVIKNNVRCHNRRRYRKNIHFTKDNKYLGGAKIVVLVIKSSQNKLLLLTVKRPILKVYLKIFLFYF